MKRNAEKTEILKKHFESVNECGSNSRSDQYRSIG